MSARSARSIQAADPSGVLRRAAARNMRNPDYDPSLFHGGKKAADDALNNAVAVTPRRVVEDTVEDRVEPTDMRRLVARKVEVPYTRKVKVPVKTTVIKPVTTQQRVKVKRLVEVPSFKEVEEEYTEVKHREETRDKEIWVKKVVQEKIMVPYEVKKTRKKKVPTTKLQEVEEWQDVEVTVDQAVTTEGYRVDEVQDTRLVEVEEEEVFELVPRFRERIVVGTRELGNLDKDHVGRRLGDRTYTAREVADIEVDQYPSDREKIPAYIYRMRERLGMVIHYSRHNGLSVRTIRRGGPAEDAGLRVGDLITALDGTRVHTLSDFRAAYTRSGETVTFSVERNGTAMSVGVTKKVLNTARGRGMTARGPEAGSSMVYESTWQQGGNTFSSSSFQETRYSARGSARGMQLDLSGM